MRLRSSSLKALFIVEADELIHCLSFQLGKKTAVLVLDLHLEEKGGWISFTKSLEFSTNVWA